MLQAVAPAFTRCRRVFLATDDAVFAQLVRQRWRNIAFTSFDLGEVDDGQARHFSDLPPPDRAIEALVNMFVLARAPVCYRTMSYLSSFCALINPSTETVTINGVINHATPFPERLLLEVEEARRTARPASITQAQ